MSDAAEVLRPATRSPLSEGCQRRLAWLSYPLLMASFYSATWWGLARGIPAETWVVVLTIAHFFTLLGLEQLLPRRPEANLLRDRQSWNDVGHGVLFSAMRPLAYAGALIGAAWGARGLQALGYASAWPVSWPFPVQVVLGIGVWAFADYWLHRAFHSIDRIWWFHSLHHDTPQMHVLKSGRLHIGEEMLNAALKPIPLLLLGVPEAVMLWVGLQNIYDGNLQHSNLAQRFPRWAHYVLPTVQLHTIHHAQERSLQDSNYSGVSPLWDLVFRTYRHPVGRLGIREAYVPRGFLAQLAFPFRAFARPQALRGAQSLRS